ncbi:MAG: hypothetical protein Ct9H300mP1_06460 [Planctomycetaceae bacterium]|nr:MAG: hypothetical protein Ct9H300mP1_06460 [Planctomycetaceae bacterium]
MVRRPPHSRPSVRTSGNSASTSSTPGTVRRGISTGRQHQGVSLSEHRGLVTLREAGKGQDIKGLLKSPLRLDDYPAPWEFHLGILQNHLGQKGLSEKQINYAIGLNLAVTFSDPKTWPKDRSKPPADLKSLQLFVVHLGSIGENYPGGNPGGSPHAAQHGRPLAGSLHVLRARRPGSQPQRQLEIPLQLGGARSQRRRDVVETRRTGPTP